MSGFSFGFSGDDIDEEEIGDVPMVEDPTTQAPTEAQLLPAQLHTLDSLLQNLPSHISFSQIQINTAQGNAQIPRRELFDVRAQLMAEDAGENEDLISGLDKGDLTSGVYEGGFKTWECSIDLAEVVMNSQSELFSSDSSSGLHCVELGAGTAVASMAVLAAFLATPVSERPASLRLTICDYNEAVLRLVTVPNMLLLWHQSLSTEQEEGELEIDEDLLRQFTTSLQEHHISLDFISGTWGSPLSQLALNSSESDPRQNRLVLASETIYSPTTVGLFTETLSQLIRGASKATALVAAKKIYFGVGGGVDDFCSHLGDYQLGYETILDVRHAGVGRVVLKVEPK